MMDIRGAWDQRAAVSVLVLAVLVGLFGCDSRPRRMKDLGSTHVATLSVTSWDDFRGDLSPEYDLTAKAALNEATPDTRTFETSVLDAVRARLGFKLAPSGVLTEGFGAPTAPAGSPDGTPPTQPGVTAAGDSIPTPNLSGDSPRLGSDGAALNSKLAGDSHLKYLAATALFQEVKLLEQYVQDAVQKRGYQAFIVRMQIANQPYADEWGYDVYANIGFFNDAVAADVSFNSETRKGLLTILGTEKRLFDTGRNAADFPEKLRGSELRLTNKGDIKALSKQKAGEDIPDPEKKELRSDLEAWRDQLQSYVYRYQAGQAQDTFNTAEMYESEVSEEWEEAFDAQHAASARRGAARRTVEEWTRENGARLGRPDLDPESRSKLQSDFVALLVEQSQAERALEEANVVLAQAEFELKEAARRREAAEKNMKLAFELAGITEWQDDGMSGSAIEQVRGLIREVEDLIVIVNRALGIGDWRDRLPIAVPLLVTDQVESALLAGRYEELRQLALAVSAAYAGIGADASLESIDQAISKAAGRSYRSLYTVGRLSDNMLRVRLAARQIPDAQSDNGFDYKTIARTHNVSLMLLVPRDKDITVDEWKQDVHVATRLEYRWPGDGDRVGPAPGTLRYSTRSKNDAKKFIVNGGYGVKAADIHEDEAIQLARLAQGNLYEEFVNKTRSVLTKSGTSGRTTKLGDETARRLYMDLQVAKLGIDFDGTSFQVSMRQPTVPSFGPPVGTLAVASLVDNGTTTEAIINGVKGLDPKRVYATWDGFRIAGRPSAMVLSSLDAKLRGPSQLVVSFPSLIKLGSIKKGSSLASGGLGMLELHHPGALNQRATVTSFLASGAPAPAVPKPSLGINVSPVVGRPVSPATTVNLQVMFDLKGTPGKPANPADAAAKKTHFVVEISGNGVQVKSISGANAVERLGLNRFVVYASGRVNFELENLPGSGQSFEIKPVVIPKGTLAPGPATKTITVR